MKKGLVHIYTGEGKGKTTASVGLAVRALGHGFKVAYASFFKRPNDYGYNEIAVLKKLGANVFTYAEGMPLANPQITTEEYRNFTHKGLDELKQFVTENKTQLLVLDEILIALKCNFIPEEELIGFIENKPNDLELVLTGRGASNKIKEVADYVTYLQKEKHPYDKGVKSREGIEF